MNEVRVNLQPTRTHTLRFCVWCQVSPGIGIVETHEGSKGKTKITGRYLVNEHERTYCRRFKVTKEAVSGGETYWVSIGDQPFEDTCDCDGFTSHAHCKHADSVRAIIDGNKFVERSSDPVQPIYEDMDYMIYPA